MILFLLFLIPITLALVVINFNREGNNIVLPLLPFFGGVLLFLPSLLLRAMVSGLFDPSYTAWGLFMQTLLKDHLLLLGFAVGWAVLLRRFLFQPVKQSNLYKTMAFFGGYYSAFNVYIFLERITHLDLYALFLLPVLTLATAIVAALLLVQIASFFGVAKYLSLAGLIVLPVACTIVTVLYTRNLPLFSIIGTIVIACLAGALFFLQKEKIY
jgi:hypothetical protein